MNVDSDRQKIKRNVDMEKNEKISWLDKVTNEEVLRTVNEDKQINELLFGKLQNKDGLAMF